MTADLDHLPISILGAGLIGTGWAALFAHHGARVTLWDPEPEALKTAPDRLAKPRADLTELDGHGPRGDIHYVSDLAAALREPALIQENAPESIPVKHALYAEIETLAPPEAILASSTSSLTWDDLAPGLTDPQRLITAHPFNPPHLVPLVELYGPDPARLDRAEALYRAAGRVPVRLTRPATGHIANRLASALWREAVHIVAEGIADVEAVDRALMHGPGLRWSVLGAHMAYHLGGGAGGIAGYLDHLGPSQERRWQDLGTPRLTPEIKDTLIAGVTTACAGRDIATLEAERDAALIAILRARAKPQSAKPQT